jgi:hypothetical protein
VEGLVFYGSGKKIAELKALQKAGGSQPPAHPLRGAAAPAKLVELPVFLKIVSAFYTAGRFS